MALPLTLDFLNGQTVEDAELDQIVAAINELHAQTVPARLTADHTPPVNNSTTLVNSLLSVPLAASATYAIDAFVMADSNTTADVKIGWTFPTGSSGTWSMWGVPASVGGSDQRIGVIDTGVVAIGTALAFTGDTSFAGSYTSARPIGTITTSSTPGNLTLRFAQNAASVYNTILKKDSRLIARRIA